MKFVNKFRNFMIGRYGSDELNIFLMKLYLFVFVLDLFFKSNIFSIVELILFVIIFYRMFSKNLYRRQSEYKLFLKLKKKLFRPFDVIKKNIKDKNHIYKRCKHCKTLMKLPIDSKIGYKYARCPKCKKETKMFVFKRDKVEIISKK